MLTSCLWRVVRRFVHIGLAAFSLSLLGWLFQSIRTGSDVSNRPEHESGNEANIAVCKPLRSTDWYVQQHTRNATPSWNQTVCIATTQATQWPDNTSDLSCKRLTLYSLGISIHFVAFLCSWNFHFMLVHFTSSPFISDTACTLALWLLH